MFGAIFIIGVSVALGAIAVTDDVIHNKRQKTFVRIFEERHETLVDFCVSLLLTKAKDWVFDDGLTLKHPHHPHLEIRYLEGKRKANDQSLQFSFQKRTMLELRMEPANPWICVVKTHTSESIEQAHDNIKLERVFSHLGALYQEFIIREREKEQVKMVREAAHQAIQKERIKQEVLVFLQNEPTWNAFPVHLSWTREVDAVSVTLTLYYVDQIQYVCFYDKTNKKLQSKVVHTEKERAFSELQSDLDEWCLKQIEKRTE